MLVVIHSFSIVTVSLPKCEASDLLACGGVTGILCNEKTGKCECQDGYEFDPFNTDLENACVMYPSNKVLPTPEGHSWTMAIILLLTFVLNVCALVFIVRRYHLVRWFRQKLFTRRDSGVTYEDVMIGQDDPPISA